MGAWSSSPRMASWRGGCSGRGPRPGGKLGGGGGGELGGGQLGGFRAGALDSGARLMVQRCEAAGGEAANRWYTLGVQGASGKQVRQLFERQGALVSRVLRTQLGPVRLERALARGQFRALTWEEVRTLLPDYAAGGEG